MRIKLPYGSTAENNQLLLPEGFLSVDLERKALRLHDGVTVGGFEMVGERAYDPFPHTRHQIPQASTYHLSHVAYGNGAYIASAGYADRLYRSVDLTHWATITLPFFNDFNSNTSIYDVAFLNGRFWAVGYYGNIFYSTNGLNWTKITSVLTVRTLNGIQLLGGRLVVHASQQRLMYSTDNGSSWVASTPPWTANTVNTNAVTYGDNKYVAAGADGTLAYTADLTSWTVASTPAETAVVTSLTYGAGRFLGNPRGVGGKLITSTNGVSWTLIDHPDPTNPNLTFALSYLNGKFYARPTNNPNWFYQSMDGVIWEKITPTGLSLRNIAYSDVLDKLFVASTSGTLAIS